MVLRGIQSFQGGFEPLNSHAWMLNIMKLQLYDKLCFKQVFLFTANKLNYPVILPRSYKVAKLKNL